jgi:hypothetical protein
MNKYKFLVYLISLIFLLINSAILVLSYNYIFLNKNIIYIFYIILFISVIYFFLPFISRFNNMISYNIYISVIFSICILYFIYKLNNLSNNTPYTVIYQFDGLIQVERFLRPDLLFKYIVYYCAQNGYKLSNETIVKIFKPDARYEDLIIFIEEEHARELAKADSGYFNMNNIFLGSIFIVFSFSIISFCYCVKVNYDLNFPVELLRTELAAKQQENLEDMGFIADELQEYVRSQFTLSDNKLAALTKRIDALKIYNRADIEQIVYSMLDKIFKRKK